MTAPDRASAHEVKRDARMLMLMGVVMVILGLLALGAPLVTGVAVAVTVGSFVLLGGILQLILGVKAESWGSRIFGIILGLVAVVCGLLLIAHPLLSLGFLTLLLAGYFVIDGMFQVVQALDIKPDRGWGATLLAGVMSVLLGILVWRQWPLSGAWAVGVLVGIKILLSGWSMIACGSLGHRVAQTVGES
ncbi:MAG: DUF308 domain-containing protein [Gemmatimonadota bacterium]|nr:MAG: DUF308 domain-containing protein [Gemmatimonadota bacterium]